MVFGRFPINDPHECAKRKSCRHLILFELIITKTQSTQIKESIGWWEQAFEIIMDSFIKSGNSMGITRKEMALRKINNLKKMIESLLWKIRSLKIRTQSIELKTRSLIKKTIKILIRAGKGILGEYSFKDWSLPSKDRVLAFCNDFSKNFGLLTHQTYNKIRSLQQGSILLSQNATKSKLWFF